MTIIAIFTDSTRPRRFIASTSKREQTFDSNLAVELTTDKNQAKSFSSLEAANAAIRKLHNPCDRIYEAGEVAVDDHLFQSYTSEGSFR